MSDLPYIVRDLQRRMANMIRRGRVHSVDFEQSPPRVKVEYEKGAVTGWLPWISGRESNKHRTDWEPLAIGEQVIILSESGELSSGVVLPSLPDATSPVPSISPDEHVSRYEDGTTFTYNRKTHTLSIDVQGDVNFHATGNVTGHIEGTADFHTVGNVTGLIEGDADFHTVGNVTGLIEGDAEFHTKGNVIAQVDGTADVTVAKSTTVKTDSTLNVEAAKDINIKTSTNMVLDASGNIDIKAGGNVKVTGSRVDLN
ncbi:phage baseplate assembly protein V [Vibrio crassostreae]|uniref:phage baseplate assembly protein V n=1 Tax=Vibrio crassostreae TaxID=246167 RepID=UPI0010436BA5|nr:phage baseplate assembly protein V [Vibrio crassostreae]TCN02937.1 phage baseplate assembly protein V [Vibrio crassostreae]